MRSDIYFMASGFILSGIISGMLLEEMPDSDWTIFLLSPQISGWLTGSGVDVEVRGWEKSSDHAPTWVELKGRD